MDKHGTLYQCAACEKSVLHWGNSHVGWESRLIYGRPYVFCPSCLSQIKSRPNRNHPDFISESLKLAFTERHGIIFTRDNL